MRLRPATDAGRAARGRPRDRRRHRRDRARPTTASSDLQRRVGASPTSTWTRRLVVEDDDGTIDRLRPLPRQRPARGRSTRSREGEGARHRDARAGPSSARRERGASTVRQGVGDRGARARALLEAHGYARVRSFWRMERDADAGRRAADETGLRAAATPTTRPRCYAINEARLRARPDYEPSREDDWTQREFGAPRPRPRLSAASRDGGRGFALVRRWEDDTRLRRRCSPSTPTTRARASAPRLLQRRLRRRRAAGRDGALNVASDNPNAVKLYERVGMTQALAGRRLPEGAARLGRQWAPSRSTLPTTSAARRWSSSRRLAPEGGAEVFGKLEMFNPGGSVKDRIGVAMIEAAEAGGPDRAGPDDDRRGHQRQHRHRARVRVRGQGLRPDPHAPAGHEPRARGPAAPLRRAGAHHRVDGRDERGRRRRAGDGARPTTSSCPTSSPTRPTRRSTAARPARSCGRRWTARSTTSSRASAPAARSPAPARS